MTPLLVLHSFIIAQVNLEGFQQAAEQNTVFAILVSLVVILFGGFIILFKRYEDKNKELKNAHVEHTKTIDTVKTEHANKIDSIRKEHAEKIDEIRQEIMEKEEERTRMWRESEKETLNILNGVNTVLEMGEKMKENDTKNIIEKINNLEKLISGLK